MGSPMAGNVNAAPHSLGDHETAWYLGQSAYHGSAWLDHEPSPPPYSSAAAAQSHPVWSVSQHQHMDDYSTPALSHRNLDSGYQVNRSDSYLMPLPPVSAQLLNLGDRMDVECARSQTHSPMHTCFSTSSDAGSVYAESTPPPPPPIKYLQHTNHLSQESLFPVVPSDPQPPIKQEGRPTNRRRTTGPAKTTAAKPGNADLKDPSAVAEKARERRSGHSAVERKYRENLNGKIEILRQVLIEAHRNYDLKAQNAISRAELGHKRTAAADMSMTHTARNGTTKEGYPPPDTVITFAATIGSKKSDVLSTAIHYIKEAEQSRSVLMQQVNFLQNQLVKLESMLCNGAAPGNGCSGGSSAGPYDSQPHLARSDVKMCVMGN